MYLTSHHVVDPSSKREGISSFLYLHGSRDWDQPPPEVPDQEPGALEAQSISVPPPGNRVRSYLDIVAPDGALWDEIRAGLMDFVEQSQSAPLPWDRVSGRCRFRMGMELGLARQWQRELAVLYRASQALHLARAR